MHRLLGYIAVAGLFASVFVHLCALSGVDVQTYFPGVWLLHLGVFIVFVPFVFSSRKTLGQRPGFAAIRAAFPTWVVVAGVCLMGYTILNFALFLHDTQGGNSSLQDGKYLLLNHGKLVREISFAEYTAFRANEVRGFSGHWMLFYFLPFAYFLFRREPMVRR